MKKILLSVLIIVIFFACSKNNNNSSAPPANPNELMPLAVGNFWQYTKITYDSSGSPVDTSLDEINIIEQITLSGTTYFQETWTSFPADKESFFINLDSNTLEKVDSATEYPFFKKVQFDSMSVDSWADTVTSHCTGHNFLYGFTDSTIVDGYSCLRNIVYVNDCAGNNFEKWIYYLKPGLGLVRILHYVLQANGTFYLQFSEDLKSYHTV